MQPMLCFGCSMLQLQIPADNVAVQRLMVFFPDKQVLPDKFN